MNTIKNNIAVIGLKGLPAYGGASTVGENIIKNLSNHYQFTVYSTSSHTSLKTGDYKNICRQIVFKAIPLKKLNTLIYYIISAIHAVVFGKYDLIHLHHSDAAFIIPFLKLKYKVIVTTHGVHISGLRPKWIKYKWFFQGQVKYFLKFADLITCVSKTEKSWLHRNHGLAAKYIPNGVNVIKNIKKDCNVEIFFGAGRIIKSKGCDIMLRGLHSINFTGKIEIAGDLNQVSSYKNEIIKLAKGLNISFLGLIIDKDKLLSHINNSFLFIFPSLSEAMSIMLLEASSIKTPIICSDIKENRDVFNSDEVLFFSLNKKDDLGNKILWAFNNYEEMEKKAENAYNKVSKTYDWKNISKKYKKQFEQFLN